MLPMTLPSLVEKLAYSLNHSLNIVDQGEAMTQVAQHGADAILPLLTALDQHGMPPESTRQLLNDIIRQVPTEKRDEVGRTIEGHLGRTRKDATRTVAVHLLGDHFRSSADSILAVLKIAEDQDEPPALRQRALRTLSGMELRGASIDRLAELLEDPEADRVLLVLDALARQTERVRAQDICKRLLRLITNPYPAVRHRAIELLGILGDLDVIERVCMQPFSEPADIEVVQRLVHCMLSKPRNVYSLRPENFEHLIKQLLERMSFEEVRVTGRVGDGGIDVEAMVCQQTGSMQNRRRVLVQCKRHREPIGPESIAAFAEQTLVRAGAVQGLFISTSAFTEGARRAVGSHRLELIDKDQLQKYLDQHFGPNLYCIRS